MTAHHEVVAKDPALAQGPIFEGRNVTIVYPTKHGHVTALNNVSVDIRPGEAIGLIGESGSGKTTLARSLLGLVPPTKGKVLYHDRDVYAMKQITRFRTLSRDAALIFQDPRSSLNPRLSVGAVIRDSMTVLRIGTRKQRRSRVIELLDRVGLPPSVASRPIRALSGGQLQRVAIARALAVEPSVVVADEPTSALDVSVQGEVLNLLQELRAQRQLALLIVSHDIRVIRFMTDRTIVMQNGEIVEQGTTTQVHEAPQHDYTRRLLAATPKLDVDAS